MNLYVWCFFPVEFLCHCYFLLLFVYSSCNSGSKPSNKRSNCSTRCSSSNFSSKKKQILVISSGSNNE